MENNYQNEQQNDPVNYKGKGINGGLVAIIIIMGAIIIALLAYIAFKPQEVTKQTTDTDAEISVENDDEVEKVKKDDDDKNVDEETTEKEPVKNEVTEEKKTNVGLKVKNEVVNEVEETELVVAPKENTSSELSSEWRSTEFILDGVKYKLYDDYSKFVAAGWKIDLVEMGYPDGYILNKNDKLSSIIDFLNDKYPEAYVNIGFINLGEGPKDITECQVWSIEVDNDWNDTEVPFTLPGGITNGSTRAEVEAAYGIPSDVYESDLGYVEYDYETAYEEDDYITFSLTIDNEKGVTGFDFSNYTK